MRQLCGEPERRKEYRVAVTYAVVAAGGRRDLSSLDQRFQPGARSDFGTLASWRGFVSRG